MEQKPARRCKATKTRRLGKRQIQYLTERLRDIDLEVYVENLAKQMEENEAVQLTTFARRGEIWRSWKDSGELKLLARFLFAWSEFVSTVSVATRETAASQKVWMKFHTDALFPMKTEAL